MDQKVMHLNRGSAALINQRDTNIPPFFRKMINDALKTMKIWCPNSVHKRAKLA